MSEEPEPPGDGPYVGPRPFVRRDQRVFRGREREARELLSLVVANRVVLLYAASGAGKTSLLNAGLIPLLEREEGFEVLGPARVGGAAAHEPASTGATNVYVAAVLSSWSPGSDSSRAPADEELAIHLRGLERQTDNDGLPVPRAIVIDQLEELFTTHPECWEQREGFVGQLARAVADDPLLRVVLTIREDRLAELDAYASILPGRLRASFRLERLGPEAALRAVVEPLDGTPRSFAPGVAEKLVSDLRTFRVDTGTGESRPVLGEFVEPVQLQVTCRSLWEGLPSEVSEISERDLREFGDVDQVLAEFYGDAVRAATAGATHLREGRLRRWIEDALVTSIGTRGTQHRAAAAAAHVPPAAIAELVNRHLLRAEWRAGSEWYELTHDRLIAPIEESNARFRAAAASRRLRAAAAGAGVLVVLLVGVAALYLSSSRAGQASITRAALLGSSIVPTIKLPVAAHSYVQDSVVRAAYACDAPTGTVVGSCSGLVSVGAPINTRVLGRQTFTVTGTDRQRGTTVTQSVPYLVVPLTFHAPTGNVSCRITSTSATCTVEKAARTFIFDRGAGRSVPSVVIPLGAGSPTNWGTTVSVGPVRCTVPRQDDPHGVTCMSSVSSHGFEASGYPQRQRFF